MSFLGRSPREIETTKGCVRLSKRSSVMNRNLFYFQTWMFSLNGMFVKNKFEDILSELLSHF